MPMRNIIHTRHIHFVYNIVLSIRHIVPMNTKSTKHLKVETIIDSTTDKDIIRQAVDAYIDGLSSIAFPNDLQHVLGISEDIKILHALFIARAKLCAKETEEIIHQINTRAKIFLSSSYSTLLSNDQKLWNTTSDSSLIVGALACVDRGIPAEAIIGPDVASLGRTLAGDIEFSYIPVRNSFYPAPSALIKRFVHYGRQGHTLVEFLIEHTSCGRRGQILANEGIHSRIPTLGYILEHIDALATEFDGDHTKNREALASILCLWHTYKRNGPSVVTPDAGLYVGIIQKIAQRQALRQLAEDITITAPIEGYEKDTGNLYAGLDKLDVLTDPAVLQAGGYTKDILTSLASADRIFSLETHAPQIYADLVHAGLPKPGAYTFNGLQSNWLEVLEAMHEVARALWSRTKTSPVIQTYITSYFSHWRGTQINLNDASDRRILHHLFHVTAYAYVLDTFTHGHTPGIHHIEQYLATGDHEIGMKPMIALGQGDLDRPDATEMYTGYSVLLHSSPGKNGTPIPVTIKLDTERTGDKPMTTEETNISIDDLHEFFRLWPYFLVGDMIPILMVRGKFTGGVSRLGLSVLRSFGDMVSLSSQTDHTLAHFVPAVNSHNEVVLVPAKDVLKTGINAGKSLSDFRSHMLILADQYSDSAIQKGFASTSF